jgi:phosphoenolpyruvate synthase/pyruvate phosphate dikinase
MRLTDLTLMIPFCRTPEDLEVYVMCEIPSKVLLADAFAEIFDGFSIGSNDLTQLVLGVDRDSEIVAGLFGRRTSGRYDRNREDRRAAVSLAHGEHRTRREAHDALGDAPEVADAPEPRRHIPNSARIRT